MMPDYHQGVCLISRSIVDIVIEFCSRNSYRYEVILELQYGVRKYEVCI